MKLRQDQVKLQGLLKETITVLCKNGIEFRDGFVIDALIGITTDNQSTFLIKLEETVGNVSGNNNANRTKSDGNASRKRRCVSSLKRPSDGDTRSTRSKRRRSADDDDDDSCNVAGDDDTNDAANDDNEADDHDDDVGLENDAHTEQDNRDELMRLKQERVEFDGNDTQADDTAPDDDSFDGGTHDVSTTKNNHDVSGSLQVRLFFGVSLCLRGGLTF